MSNEYGNSEVSLKELIEQLQSYAKELLKNWLLILIICCLTFALIFAKEYFATSTHTSKLTFMMNGDDNSIGLPGMLGGIAGLAGAGDKNLDKMIKLIKSRSTIREALFVKQTINGEYDFYANHILKLEDVEVFTDETQTDLFYFTRDTFGKTDRLENKALLKIHKFLKGGDDPGKIQIPYDELSGIITLESTFNSEELAVEFPTELYEVAERKFINNTIKKNQVTHDIIEAKYDSITSVIASKEYQIVAYEDGARNLLLNKDKFQRAKLDKDLRLSYGQLQEVIKLKEQSEFTLRSITPVIISIDLPIYPIKPNDTGIIKIIILSLIAGVFFSGIFIVGRKAYRDTMAKE